MTVSPQLPVLDFSHIGPSVGSRLPDVRLPDQTGRLVDVHAELGNRQTLVVFYREQSYRVRPTARIFEEYALGTSEASPPPVDAPRASGPGLQVQVWTDAPTYRPYQQLRLHVELSLPPDLHVMASPIPDGYTPLSLQVERLEALEVGEPVLPSAQPFTLDGLEEQFLVYESIIRTMIPLRFTKNLGSAVVTLRVEYQACAPTMCYSPTTLRVDVPLNGLDLIRD